MSIFEIVMLICFGAAWPFSIYKSWTARSCAGKSVIFLYIVVVGYVSGLLHKMIYNFDAVVFLYGLNLTMVLIDIRLFYRNRRLMRLAAGA